MRIVTWNCLSGFERKWPALMKLKPDVAVIQEISRKGLKDFLAENAEARSKWIGESGGKGLAVIAWGDWKLRRLKFSTRGKKFFLPVALTRGRAKLDLIAVWTKAVKNSHESSYIGQAFDYLKANKKFINESSVIVGDFNANAIWDSGRRAKTFSAVRDMLREIGHESAYHHFFGEKFGSESRPTFFLQKNFSKGYHIDYCFLSRLWKRKLTRVQIVARGQWGKLTHSDHRPLVLDFKGKF